MLQLLLNIIKLFFNKKTITPAPPAPAIIIADANEVLVHEARKWVGIVEVGGDNTGPEVEMFQKAVDGKANKEPWCAAFVMFCIKQVEAKLNIKSGIYRSELVQDLWFKSPASMRSEHPKPGCLILWRYGNTQLGHVGIIEAVEGKGSILTIEGNTSSSGAIVREGGGVHRKHRTVYGTQAMPVLGFLKVF